MGPAPRQWATLLPAMLASNVSTGLSCSTSFPAPCYCAWVSNRRWPLLPTWEIRMELCHLQTGITWLSICVPLISFSCLIVLAKTRRTILNEDDGGQHPCLVPDLRVNALGLSPFNMMLAMGSSHTASIMLRCVPFTPYLCTIFFF